jgi:hypothetical protein
MHGRGRTRPLNAWERQFYRQLLHRKPGDADIEPAQWPDSGDGDCAPSALEAALRRALVDSERLHVD